MGSGASSDGSSGWSRACSPARSGAGCGPSSSAGGSSGRWTTTARSTSGAAPSCPTHFTVAAQPRATTSSSPRSHDSLARELGDAAREHARDEGYTLHGAGRGRARRRRPAAHRRLPDRRAACAEGEGGSRRRLARAAHRRARPARRADRSPSAASPESTIVLADPNVSRSHAEIRPQGDGFVVVDLGSTNGIAGQRRPRHEPGAARRRRGLVRQHPHALRGVLTGPPPGPTDDRRLDCHVRAAAHHPQALPAGCCSTSSSSGCCGRCGPRSTPPEGRRGAAAQAASASQAPPRHAAAASAAPLAAAPSSSPPPSKGRTFPLGRGAHRRPGRGLPGHPRRHLRVAAPRPRLRRGTGSCFVEDLGSTNGTYLNRRKVHGPDGHAAGATGSRSATPCWSCVMTALRVGRGHRRRPGPDHQRGHAVLVADADLFAVADGMGGHRGGEVASALAVETLQARTGRRRVADVAERGRAPSPTGAIFERGRRRSRPARHGHHAVRDRAWSTTTEGDEVVGWVNVGDSRVYLFRDGELAQLTEDHSLVEDLRARRAAHRPRRPRSTRSATSSPGRSASTRTSTSTRGPSIPSHGRPLPALQRRPLQRGRRRPDRRRAPPPRRPGRGGRRAGAPGQRGRRPGQHHRASSSTSSTTAAPPKPHRPRWPVPPAPSSRRPSRRPPPSTTRPTTAAARRPQALRRRRPPDVGADDERRRRRRRPQGPRRRPAHAGSPGGSSRSSCCSCSSCSAAPSARSSGTARSTYYVGFDGDEVVIYQGRPGGVLWVEPDARGAHRHRPRRRPARSVPATSRTARSSASLGDARAYVAQHRRPDRSTTTTTQPRPRPRAPRPPPRTRPRRHDRRGTTSRRPPAD